MYNNGKFLRNNEHNTNRERHWVRRCIQIKKGKSERHVEK